MMMSQWVVFFYCLYVVLVCIHSLCWHDLKGLCVSSRAVTSHLSVSVPIYVRAHMWCGVWCVYDDVVHVWYVVCVVCGVVCVWYVVWCVCGVCVV